MSEHGTRLRRLHRSPARLIALVASSVFVAEAMVMALLAQLPPFSLLTTIVLDATFLLILLAPVFVYFIFRPLVTQIAEHRRAQETLALERNRLKSILDAMDDAVFIINGNRGFDYANASVVKLFGPIGNRTCSEYFAGMQELCPWKRQPDAEPFVPIRAVLQIEQVGRLLESTILPIRCHDDSIAMLEILHDITDRRKSSEEVRNIYQAVEQNSTAVVIVDISGKIEYVNPRFTALTGYSREEVYGRNPSVLKSGCTPVEKYREIWETITSGREWRGEILNKKKNGDLYWEQNTISPITDDEGVITHYVAVKEDISERKRVEQELSASREQLRNLSGHLQQVREEERTSIAREIHDELGQALATLQLSVSLIQRELGAGQARIREQVREMSQIITTTVHRVQRICAELRPVMLDELGLVSALEWLCSQFEKKSGVRCELVSDLQAAELSAPLSMTLFRIFQESLTNVIRHAEAGMVDASLVGRSGWVTLRVRDNGRGIQPGQIRAGTSYGLIGMRERAAVLGGRARIYGFPGKGTVVLVRLPLKKKGVEE